MTKEQLDYVLHPLETESFLKACPGSGKTECIAIKAAYVLRARRWNYSGIAFLTFTNNAADVIADRVSRTNRNFVYPHFIGTFDSWLHGYILNPFGHRETKYAGEGGDHSVSIVDNLSSASFLHAYKTKKKAKDEIVPEGGPVFAHQFFYEVPSGTIEFKSNSDGLDKVRQKFAWTPEQFDDLKRIKAAFWKAGFGIHADVLTICYRVLRSSSVLRGLVAKRFPFVVVDECQDLSPGQLCLLDELRQSGTKLHFVGDLNQAIDSFRKVDPSVVRDFVSKRSFATPLLTGNFRSVQPIVDTCGRVVCQGAVTGRVPVGSDPACVYFVYGNDVLSKLVEQFEALVRRRAIETSKCLILGRGKALVAQLGLAKGALPTNPTHRVAHAVHLWKSGVFEFRDEALRVIGEFVADNFFPSEPTNARFHYCPRSLSSAMKWRMFLARILDACVADTRLGDFNQTWTKWAAGAKGALPPIVASVVTSSRDAVEVSFSAPKGKKDELVASSFAKLANPSNRAIRASTIHAAKGETVDALLVVSSKDGSGGKGGFWRDWLDSSRDDGEHARFAYVASSRPRQLLAWAVPKLSDGDAERLTALGFHRVS